jgi:hypothetical protein
MNLSKHLCVLFTWGICIFGPSSVMAQSDCFTLLCPYSVDASNAPNFPEGHSGLEKFTICPSTMKYARWPTGVVENISKVTAEKYVLRDRDMMGRSFLIWIDRISGMYHDEMVTPEYFVYISGSCSKSELRELPITEEPKF